MAVLAELYGKNIVGFLGLEPALMSTGASLSILNGELGKIKPNYWVVMASLMVLVELANSARQRWMMMARQSRIAWQKITASIC